MSYEVEAVAPTITPTDASIATSPVMREERVVEPYRQRVIKAPTALESGQSTIHETSVTAPAAGTLPKPPEGTVTLSPQMAALARKEQAFRRQQQEFKAQLAQAQAQQTELAQLRAMKSKLESKDFSEIENLVPYNDYATWLIEKGTQVTPEQQALKKIESRLDEVDQRQKTDVEKRFEAAVADRRNAVKELVGLKPDFSSIKELKQEEAVVQHILDTWEHDEIELTVEQAAQEVEQALVEQGSKWSFLTKLKTASPLADKRELPPLKPGARTLTNEMTIQGEVKSPRKSFQGMTDGERYAEARRRAEEKLKQGVR